MSITEKINQIKALVALVCDILPSVVSVIREIITLVKDVKTA